MLSLGTAAARAVSTSLVSAARRALHSSMSTMAAQIARHWTPPEDTASAPKLMLYNSLLDEKVPFVPAAGPGSRRITWYSCGPTVYDSAHMGHARNYVSFDIVKRVLEDYFGYNCLFVMNVTDVDDKIILRARRNHLLAQYKQQNKPAAEVLAFAEAAVRGAQAKQGQKHEALAALAAQAAAAGAEAEQQAAAGDKKASSAAQRKREELEGAAKQEAHKLSQISAAAAGLAALAGPAASADAVLAVAGDYVAEVLDKEHGAGVTDPSIYRAHAARFEREFFEDYEALGCRRPDVLTRVSEYIPEIIDYVVQIVQQGMAYESNGSVYFSTTAFKACGHVYGKLKPWAVGSAALAAEGESNFETSEKRSATDFALWKAAKPGEPAWDSPWGRGRPGWHIECSAMASSIIGPKLDIHTGGEDLRFPHHDNELAQAEAYYHADGCSQWVNYFLHAGHLNIEGLKMSKSLKNFVTIREALQTFSPRQLRLMFVLQQWNRPMVYGESSRQEMRAKEALLKNFFQNVEVALREPAGGSGASGQAAKWGPDETALAKAVEGGQQAIHTALLDNINTAGAMDAVCEIIRDTNVYLAKVGSPSGPPHPQPLLLRKAAATVTRFLSAVGLVDGPGDQLGFSDAAGGGAAAAAGTDAQGARYLDAFAAFRDEVRSMAKAKAEPAAMLAACDRLRDVTLADLGVRLEDRPDGRAVWKLDDPAALRVEQEERARAAAEAAARKVAAALEKKSKDLEKLRGLAALPTAQAALSDKYSQFDEATGEPTHDKDGAALEGKAKDKARKDWEKQVKVREPLAKRLAEDGPEALDKLAAEVQELTRQLAALGTTASTAPAAAVTNGTK